MASPRRNRLALRGARKYIPPIAAHGGPSGEAMPTADLPGWQLVFADDFLTDIPLGGWTGCADSGTFVRHCTGLLGTEYYNKWWAYPDSYQNSSKNNYYNATKCIAINNSVLTMWLHTDPVVGPVGAVPIPTGFGAPWGAGQHPAGFLTTIRWSVRWKVRSEIPGYKQAWLLWPHSNIWPRDGEIDYPEIGQYYHSQDVKAYQHDQLASQTSTKTQQERNTGHGGTDNVWRTSTVEWIAGVSTNVFENGVQVGTTITTLVPNTDMNIRMQTEGNLSGTPIDPATEGFVDIDWVCVWQGV